MSSLPAWLVDVKQRLPQWIDQLAHPDGPGRYRFAVDAYEAYEAYSSMLMNTIIRTTGGGTHGMPTEKEKAEWADYLCGFQRPDDGLFVDPALERHLLMHGGVHPPEEDLFRFRYGFSRNVISAICRLDGRPDHRLAHQEVFNSPDDLIARFESYDWRNPWGAGAWAGAALKALDLNRTLGDDQADELIQAGIAWLGKRQDPATGVWSDGSTDIPLHTLINGIFKVWIQAVPLGLPVQYPEQIIDLCLRGLREDDHLNDRVDACSSFDVALVLDTALRFTNHRRAEAADAARNHLPLIAPLVRPDGAFSYGPAAPHFYIGQLALAPMIDQANTSGTALLTQAVAMLANIAGLRDELQWTPTTEWAMGLT